MRGNLERSWKPSRLRCLGKSSTSAAEAEDDGFDSCRPEGLLHPGVHSDICQRLADVGHQLKLFL